jgi:hypothetical protein
VVTIHGSGPVAITVTTFAVFSYIYKFITCIFSEGVASVCPSRAVTCKSGPVEGVGVPCGNRS